jgi:ribosomal protein S18 acetylase RimI-like enzyme
MNDLQFETIEGEPNETDMQVLVDGMLSYHASKGHPRKVDTYSVTIKNDEGILVGCVMVSFLWNGMEIGSLWVDESMRGQGLGQKLMTMAEDEGRKRGATFAYTNTFTWQALGFYEKLGYSLYGKLEDFPADNQLSYYRKNLIKE